MIDEQTLKEINTCPLAKNRKEERYISGRKVKAFWNSVCFYLCRIFPIKKKLISICTFEGKGGFGCNPKYIVQELHKQHPEYEFVWFVNKASWEKEFPSYVKKVPNTVWSRAYWLTRSKIWLDNYRKPLGTIKRRGQYYLNTNHYTIGIKTVGLLRGSGFSKMAYLVSKNDSDMIDSLIIDSSFSEEMVPKGLIYAGNLLKTGAPRCDVLYGNRSEAKKNFCKRHNISENAKIVMFAPTFREGAKDGKRSVYSNPWTIDFKRLLENLTKRFGGDWYICVRVHPQLAPTFEDYKDPVVGDKIINESQADDLYEILAGMDVYITDYSSACFEAGFAKMPVFLYADDIDQYKEDRGALFWDIQSSRLECAPANPQIFKNLKAELPFPIVMNNEALEEKILSFDEEKYNQKLKLFHENVNLTFTGTASKDVVKWIEERM